MNAAKSALMSVRTESESVSVETTGVAPFRIEAGDGAIEELDAARHERSIGLTLAAHLGAHRRAPDTQVIPLCPFHHTGPDGIHTRRAWWVETFGEDADYLPVVADMLASQFNGPWKV